MTSTNVVQGAAGRELELDTVRALIDDGPYGAEEKGPHRQSAPLREFETLLKTIRRTTRVVSIRRCSVRIESLGAASLKWAWSISQGPSPMTIDSNLLPMTKLLSQDCD